MKYWKSKAKHSYLSVNKAGPGKLRREIFLNLVVQQQIVDYRAGAGARSKWNGSTVHNTALRTRGNERKRILGRVKVRKGMVLKVARTKTFTRRGT